MPIDAESSKNNLLFLNFRSLIFPETSILLRLIISLNRLNQNTLLKFSTLNIQ